MLETEFTFKIVGKAVNEYLSTDILSLDLEYDLNEGQAILSLEMYILRTVKELPQIENKRKFNTPFPSEYKYSPIYN